MASGTFSRTMTPNTHLGRPQNGLKTIKSKFYHGQHSLQTLTPLSTSGNISNDNFGSTATKGAHELWDRLVDEWNGISPEVCQNLIESKPRRIQAVIKANGGHTKY